ncbi:hypothetical protein GE09DRAFT_1067025 [Coniochaeta sp. 2T2.1]|nr:hypothetical protein GE09DRAFT_1067025 [Coniochaeta sp. 2T2.1]
MSQAGRSPKVPEKPDQNIQQIRSLFTRMEGIESTSQTPRGKQPPRPSSRAPSALSTARQSSRVSSSKLSTVEASLILLDQETRAAGFQPGTPLPMDVRLISLPVDSIWAQTHGIFAIPPTSNISETSIARFVRPAWVNPDMGALYEFEELFPTMTPAPWIRSSIEFRTTFRMNMRTYAHELFNLEGYLIRRDLISGSNLQSALILALGDIIGQGVWIGSILEADDKYENIGNESIDQEKYFSTRFQVWLIHWDKMTYWTAIIFDTHRTAPAVFFFDSYKEGRYKKMEQFRKGTFRR